MLSGKTQITQTIADMFSLQDDGIKIQAYHARASSACALWLKHLGCLGILHGWHTQMATWSVV